MPQERTLDDRLSALERSLETVTDPGGDRPDAPNTRTDRPDAPNPHTDPSKREDSPDLENRIATLEDRLADLEAGLQAVRGYVGNVEHVNQSVERRANAAIAAVERIESAPTTQPPVATAERQRSPESTSTSASAETEAEPASADTKRASLLERLLATV